MSLESYLASSGVPVDDVRVRLSFELFVRVEFAVEVGDRILCEDATVESNLDGLERLPREPRQDRRGRYRCGSCHACLRCGRHRHHRHAPQDEGVGPMENGRGSGASRTYSLRPFSSGFFEISSPAAI